ncbi:hypothetical protein Cgig2_027044 [Carnegiea gigantea]|uniref:Uncharacterized protein n=1 Tax=Carnegiea gigantea TaxID=171969 RepID=A0A9Q1K994_9CARY|nr:hypothetical protein Cgig2_027044 [Carnegiea gigantea]
MSFSRSNQLGDGCKCSRCHMQGIRKVSHSSQNPGRGYMKCLRCNKFLKWVNDDNEMEKRILMMLTEINKELSELRILVKLIEKGQSVGHIFTVINIFTIHYKILILTITIRGWVVINRSNNNPTPLSVSSNNRNHSIPTIISLILLNLSLRFSAQRSNIKIKQFINPKDNQSSTGGLAFAVGLGEEVKVGFAGYLHDFFREVDLG